MEKNKAKDICRLPDQMKEILDLVKVLNDKIEIFFEAEVERHDYLSAKEVKAKTVCLYEASWKMSEVIEHVAKYVGVLISENIMEVSFGDSQTCLKNAQEH